MGRSRISGVLELRRKAGKLPAALRDEINQAHGETIEDVHRDGLMNMDAMVKHRKGILRREYHRRLLKKSLKARVGYLRKASRAAAYYARFVHDGTIKMVARPWHGLAVEKHMPAHDKRMARARRRAHRKALGG